jgi:hypothetical protein
MLRIQMVTEFYRKNFGFFLGPIGRCSFLLFSGMICFGIASPDSPTTGSTPAGSNNRDGAGTTESNVNVSQLSIATGILIIIWAVFNALVALRYKEYFSSL